MLAELLYRLIILRHHVRLNFFRLHPMQKVDQTFERRDSGSSEEEDRTSDEEEVKQTEEEAALAAEREQKRKEDFERDSA